jgi:hypothetical protein
MPGAYRPLHTPRRSTPLLSLIRALWEAGLTPFPRLGASPATVYLQPTGEVTPIAWSHYKRQQPDWSTVETWFATGDLSTVGVQLLCGTPAYPKDPQEPLLQILDIENAEIFEQWREELNYAGHADILYRCTLERTPSGGAHMGFRCPAISDKATLPLAKRPTDTGTAVLIELLQHHCCTVSPTAIQCKPTHPAGVAYTVVQGDWRQVQVLSPAQRHVLIDAARAFNEVPERIASDRRAIHPDTGNRPGDRLNALADLDWWTTLLTTHGWRDVTRPGASRKGVTTFQRPGKYGRQGSATYGVCGPCLYVLRSVRDACDNSRQQCL